MKVAAIYVLYNPDLQQLMQSVDMTRKFVDIVILIDNTDEAFTSPDIKDNTVIYKDLNGNKGIATALNVGCGMAKSTGCEWALLMDQDSLLTSDFVKEYKNVIGAGETGDTAILCPQYTNSYSDENDILEHNIEEIPSAITSGSFLNLKIHQQLGGFREDLFIDAVDTEFSWRAITRGYKIRRLNWLLLKHEVGHSPYDVNLFGHRILTVDNHNYLRCYYITRNNIVVNNEYSDLLPEYTRKNKKTFKLVVKVLLYESDKWNKLKAIYWGIKDARKGIMGKYNH